MFDERIRLSPEGCYVLAAKGAVVGYFASHPWTRKKPPALHQMLGRIPDDADCWYVHDVAVDPVGRGGGAVAQIVDRILGDAALAGYRIAMLIAVSGAGAYWSRLGFQDVTTEALREKLKDYGEDAVYMERSL